MTAEPKIAIRGLAKRFGATRVLAGIDLDIAAGEVVAVIGPSGSGKSTLLRCMNLLVTPDAGNVRIGTDSFVFAKGTRPPAAAKLAAFRAQTGMVFQHFNLFPHKSTLGNVMEGPLAVRRMGRAEAETLARGLLAKVGLADKADEFPSRLSGGQKQRVAIARALAMQPDVMLLDEITSALDPELVGEVLGVVKALAREGMTMIIVTHEIAFAREVADRVVFMRDGAIVEDGPAHRVIDEPREASTRAFLEHFHRRGGERAETGGGR